MSDRYKTYASIYLMTEILKGNEKRKLDSSLWRSQGCSEHEKLQAGTVFREQGDSWESLCTQRFSLNSHGFNENGY